jgi:metal-dependent hydrolase (beta-lactamase superfamily II)
VLLLIKSGANVYCGENGVCLIDKYFQKSHGFAERVEPLIYHKLCDTKFEKGSLMFNLIKWRIQHKKDKLYTIEIL